MRLSKPFLQGFPTLGVVHLPPLPGSARSSLSFDECLKRALSDGAAYVQAGFSGLIVENYGDAPFSKHRARPHVPSILALAARALIEELKVPVGINCLRNDALSALGAAAASGASFIRVNVLIGATATDQGVIEGCAHRLHAYRKDLGADVSIAADVYVKHGTPLFAPGIADAACATVDRGLADLVIVTGKGTSWSPSEDDLSAVHGALRGRAPVWIGSGANEQNIGGLAMHADGVIVGSACKIDGHASNAVDPERAERFMTAIKSLRNDRAGMAKNPATMSRGKAPRA